MRTASGTAQEDVDDVIMLDLRDNREELGYSAVKSDYSAAPADAHIPAQLTPDPLMAGEPANPQPQPFPDTTTDEGGEKEDIKNTELYRRLQEGLSNFEKLVQGETFKREIQRSGVDLRKYSSHLGRAEYGDLNKRSSLGNLVTSGEYYYYRSLCSSSETLDLGRKWPKLVEKVVENGSKTMPTFLPLSANCSHFLPKPRQPKASVSLEEHKHPGSLGRWFS